MLKACVRYFLSNFYFSPNDSPSKTVKNVSYFLKKALFVLEIFKFLYVRLPLFFTMSAIALSYIHMYVFFYGRTYVKFLT